MSTISIDFYKPINTTDEWNHVQEKIAEYKIHLKLAEVARAMVAHFEFSTAFTKRLITWIEKNYQSVLDECGIQWVSLDKTANMAYLKFHFKEYAKGDVSFFLDYLKCSYNPEHGQLTLAKFDEHNKSTEFCKTEIERMQNVTMEQIEELVTEWNTHFLGLKEVHNKAAKLAYSLEYRFYVLFDSRYGSAQMEKES